MKIKNTCIFTHANIQVLLHIYSGDSHATYHITHPPLLLKKQLVLNVIIVQTLE